MKTLLTTLLALTLPVTGSVRPLFTNETGSASVTVFNGHVKSDPAPTSQNATLISSSFGQHVAFRVPYQDYVQSKLAEAQSALYNSTSGAVRYQDSLYIGSGSTARADSENIGNLFGDAERSAFASQIQPLLDALAYDPHNFEVRTTLLEAYYDLAVAEVQFAKNNVKTAARYRLDLQVPPVGTTVLDQEILLSQDSLAQFQRALAAYGQLFSSDIIADPDSADALDSSVPPTHVIFRDTQPIRSLTSNVARFNPDSGTTEDAADRTLFEGYKDYVAILDILKGYAEEATELTRLYALRNLPGDQDEGTNTIDATYQDIIISLNILESLFSEVNPPESDPAGISNARQAIQSALGELANSRETLRGNFNPLGFDRNFLLLIRSFVSQNGGEFFDSYDSLEKWIQNNSTSPLPFAESTYDDAKATFDTYQGNASQVHAELGKLQSAYEDRYIEILGKTPQEVSDDLAMPNPINYLENPVPGSEMDDALREREIANLRVDNLNRQKGFASSQFDNLNAASTKASGQTELINNAFNDYQDATGPLYAAITTANAAAAASQAAYDTVAAVDPADTVLTFGISAGVKVGAGVANGVVQTAAATTVGVAEGNLDAQAALLDRKLALGDAAVLADQAAADLNGIQREQASIELDYQEALTLQQQSIARVSLLNRELARLDAKIASDTADLHDRYFADPIHYFRSQASLLRADNAFRNAQRWVFYTVRALEYKWNQPFIFGDFETADLFRLRNFRELEDFVAAMVSFNGGNLSTSFTTVQDVISLRDDILAPFAGEGPDDGIRFDTTTSEFITKEELFRRRLASFELGDSPGTYVIPFDTFAVRKATGRFFKGTSYSPSGVEITRGDYLDKINGLRISVIDSRFPALPASGTVNPENIRVGSLGYGGTTYVRTQQAPAFEQPDSTRLPNEFRAFPFYYYFTLDGGQTWNSSAQQRADVSLVFTSTTDREPSDVNTEANFLRERSVAATDWSLTIPQSADFDLDSTDDILIWVSHRFAPRSPAE